MAKGVGGGWCAPRAGVLQRASEITKVNMQSSRKIRAGLVLTAALGSVLLTACASTSAAPRLAGPLVAGFRITRRDILSVKVDAPPSAEIPTRQTRILAREISRAIRHLQNIDPPAGGWRAYEIAVHITRYARGGRSGQAAPLGRVRVSIAGSVQVFSFPQHRLEETFALSSAAPRGGIFAASGARRSAERVFAQEIAQALTGLNPGSPQS